MATKNSRADVFDSILQTATLAFPRFDGFMVVNHKEEKNNDLEYAKKLASRSDVYMDDAFGTAHIGIGHASTGGVAKRFKTSVVGSSMQEDPFYRLIGDMNPEKLYALSLEKGDLYFLGGGLTSAYMVSRVVNMIHAVGVGQNQKEINVLVPIASHLQHVNCIKNKRPRDEGSSNPPIIFTDDDLDGVQVPHIDPLVIPLIVDDQLMDKFFVDQGSSFDIMYLNGFEELNPKLKKTLKPTMTVMIGFNGQEERPLGVVKLPIHAGSALVQVDFLVVKATSECNGILGRPFLHMLGAVGSSFHQKLKFPTEKGIEEIRGDQAVSRVCSMVALMPKVVPVPDGCMGSDSGPMAVLDFDKYVEEGETDANELEDVGGMGVTTAVEKVGASLELLEEKSLPEVPALDDA